jgi:hypothetical protein
MVDEDVDVFFNQNNRVSFRAKGAIEQPLIAQKYVLNRDGFGSTPVSAAPSAASSRCTTPSTRSHTPNVSFRSHKKVGFPIYEVDNKNIIKSPIIRGNSVKNTNRRNSIMSSPDKPAKSVEHDHRKRSGVINKSITISNIFNEHRPKDNAPPLVPDRKYIFNLSSGPVADGAVAQSEQLTGKSVKWKATIDKPIEDLIYPSLRVIEIKTKKVDAFKSWIKKRGEPEKDEEMEDDILKAKWHLEISDNKCINFDSATKELVSSLNKGESYIRLQMKKKIDSRLEDEKKQTVISKLGIKGNESEPIARARHKLDKLEASKSIDNSADTLFYELKRKRVKGKLDKSLIGANIFNHKTVEEICYDNQKKIVDDFLPNDLSYHEEGVLIYRIQNQIRLDDEIENQKYSGKAENLYEGDDMSLDDDTNLNSRYSKFMNSNLIEKNNRSLKLGSLPDLMSRPPSSPSPMHRVIQKLQNESRGAGISLSLDINTDNSNNTITTEYFARIRQALNSRYVGYDFKEIEGKANSENTVTKSNSNILFGSNSTKKTRVASDLLLLAQLKKGIIPERFFKKGLCTDGSVGIDLSDYGIGDDHAICLGESIIAINTIGALGLRNNRLTGLSISIILKNSYAESLKHLDLSSNNLSKGGIEALTDYLKSPNKLAFLNLSKCKLKCFDINLLCKAQLQQSSIEDFILGHNLIGSDGCMGIAELLTRKSCKIKCLDLSWNDIRATGISFIATSLQYNKTCTSLDVSANGINDKGGCSIAMSILHNKTLVEVRLEQNLLNSQSCFVFARAIRFHPTMERLDLSCNPLGEAGIRAVFRSIVSVNLPKCFVLMRNCSKTFTDDIFNHTNAARDSPYDLDLSDPYSSTIYEELLRKTAASPFNCKIEATYKDSSKGTANPIALGVKDGVTVIRGTSTPYTIPATGFVRIEFRQTIPVPKLEMAIHSSPLKTLILIIVFAKNEQDRKLWMSLLCKDLYFTTIQCQLIIDTLESKKILGSGGLTKIDVFEDVWTRVIDNENKYEFLNANLDKKTKREFIGKMTFEQFKFNWKNPTGHYRINLSEKSSYSLMQQLIAINDTESRYSERYSRRGDTSQRGNYFNFRNEVMDGVDFNIDREFTLNLPSNGIVEFDYVSTSRPKVSQPKKQKVEIVDSKPEPLTPKDPPVKSHDNSRPQSPQVEFFDNGKVVDSPDGEKERNANNDDTDNNSPRSRAPSNMDELSHLTTPDIDESKTGPSSRATTPQTQSKNIPIEREITDEEFFQFQKDVGLICTTKISLSDSLLMLVELQVAVAKYYFRCSNVLQILDAFLDDAITQSRVIVCLFGRLWDLWNFDIIMRQLNQKAQYEVILRLGWLNIINPLKPSFDYIIKLMKQEDRILLVTLMELATTESGEQIIEDQRTELTIFTLYGALNRVMNESRPETLIFSYSDIGERSTMVNWSGRREFMKRFLVGTYPINRETYQCITWYKEIEAAGNFTIGPIDLQYDNHLRTLKASSSRSKSIKRSVSQSIKLASKPLITPNELPISTNDVEDTTKSNNDIE